MKITCPFPKSLPHYRNNINRIIAIIERYHSDNKLKKAAAAGRKEKALPFEKIFTNVEINP
ncbi:MAG: hypothetical protein FWE59_01735 [Oscillospiraceae bacterium]|nr:hypothetical protein [Oscillospiraceae bacterium]